MATHINPHVYVKGQGLLVGKLAHRLCYQHPYLVHNFRNTYQTSKPWWSRVPHWYSFTSVEHQQWRRIWNRCITSMELPADTSLCLYSEKFVPVISSTCTSAARRPNFRGHNTRLLPEPRTSQQIAGNSWVIAL